MKPFLLVNRGSGDGRVQQDIVAVATRSRIPHHVAAPGDDFRRVLTDAVEAGEVWVYIGGGLDVGRSLTSTVTHAVHTVVSQQILHAAYCTDHLVILADRADIPVAVDGELHTDLVPPLELTSQAGALRVIAPNDPAPRPVEVLMTW